MNLRIVKAAFFVAATSLISFPSIAKPNKKKELDWHVTRVVESKPYRLGYRTEVTFADGRKLIADFWDAKFEGFLERGGRPPFLIFNARDCTDCGAEQSLVFALPASDSKKQSVGADLIAEHYLSAPGVVLANEANYDKEKFKAGPKWDTYAFLNGSNSCGDYPNNSVVIFESDLRESHAKHSVTLVTVSPDGALKIEKKPGNFAHLKALQKDKEAGKCSEIPRMEQMEPT